MVLMTVPRSKSALYVILSLSLFFGWLLSFPFHGPVLNIYSEARGFNPGYLSTLFIAFHGGGILLSGFVAGTTRSWRHLIRPAGIITLVAAAAILAVPPDVAPFLFALSGASSGVFIVAWSVPFSLQVSPAFRIQVMAAIIAVANIVYIAVKLSLIFSMPGLGNTISMVSLIAATAVVLLLNTAPGDTTKQTSSPVKLPAVLIGILCATIFLLYINGGFMYLVLYPSSPESLTWLPIFRDLVYLSTLITMAISGARIDRMVPVYLSASLMILAFAFYSLFGSSTVGWISAEVLCQSSMALLDLFLWTVLGDIAFTYKRPYTVFGWGLSANVAGILAGGFIGGLLIRLNENPELIIAVSTGTSVSLTFLLIPLLAARLLVDLLEKINLMQMESHREAGENTGIRVPPAHSIPGFVELSPRETEIAGLILRSKNNQEIADKLFISENTVKVHLKNIYRKLSVAGKNEFLALVVSAYENSRG